MNKEQRVYNTFPRAPQRPAPAAAQAWPNILHIYPSTGPYLRRNNTTDPPASVDDNRDVGSCSSSEARGSYTGRLEAGGEDPAYAGSCQGTLQFPGEAGACGQAVQAAAPPAGWEGREGARGGHRLALHSSFFLGVFNAAPKRVLGFRGGTGPRRAQRPLPDSKSIRGEHGPGR